MARVGGLHSFYIPVMGTGFTIDTPLLIAKYGISSVISLVDDVLIEQMRKYWAEVYHEPYQPITALAPDCRAMRITAYLNLLNKLISAQLKQLKESVFASGSEINKYFELLPSHHPLFLQYQAMLSEKDEQRRHEQQERLREQIVPGSIDVNIMTKLDVKHPRSGAADQPYNGDASAALRGFANSDLNATIVLSAGFSPNLYGYLTEFADFYPDEQGEFKKYLCLKVSDYRSAEIQGKYLAKRGIWVSEFRIESPFNCGGHAFFNDGQVLGKILEQFRQRRQQLVQELHEIYQKGLWERKQISLARVPDLKITAQGGVGTHEEHEFLLQHYQLDAVGWGSPFLLVPEATNVDESTMQKLLSAQADDVYLSTSSPVGVPFWTLRNSLSNEQRVCRIQEGKPGSFCVKGYTRFDTEFTKQPICRASRQYQQLKLAQIEQMEVSAATKERLREITLSRACICHELSGGAVLRRGIDLSVNTAICPGPNILNFKKIASLKEMVGHIYGKLSLLSNTTRPHMFVSELKLQVAQIMKDLADAALDLPSRSQKKLLEVKQNLLEGIEYYRQLVKELSLEQQESFLAALQEAQQKLEEVLLTEQATA